MKIGILTYHRAINYGAFLQACALCNRLIAEGYDAEIIDYRTEKEKVRYSLEKWSARKKLSHYCEYRFYKTLVKAFQREYDSPLFKVSDENLVSDSIEDFQKFAAGKYDVIISGSDEVWKTGGRGFPNAYWQIGDLGARKISYAASGRCDYRKLPIEKQKEIVKAINQYEYIGIRDQITFDALKSYVVDRNRMYLNCDPSLIYDYPIEKASIESVIKRRTDRRKYDSRKKTIVFMCEDKKLAEVVYRGLCRSYNLVSVFIFHKKYINLPDLSPLEWLSLIANADFVIADYFHAVCFSIKNSTPFLAIGTPSKVSKLSELLDGEFDHYFIKKFESITPQEMAQLVEDRMKPMDNSDFLRRMEARFQEFLKMLGADKSRIDIAEQENKQLMENILSEIGDEMQLSRAEMRNVAQKEDIDCCGCGLCANICPKNAIKMQMDTEGFYRPAVDSKKCVNCGICVKSCIHDANWAGLRKNNGEPRAYAFKHSNEEVRSNSRSGGFFTVVSDYVLRNDGVVYGSAFNEGTQVKHIRAVTHADRDRMRGSKYVMSPSFELFPQVKADLQAGKYVLYSGCPCQAAALKKYVEKEDCSKLILVDLLCLGVPSIRVWNDYVDYCQKAKHGKITEFQFRNKKRLGWAAHKESYVINGREYISNAFADLFHSHHILNKACSQCKFKSTDRVSDFTLGDFWGIDDAIPGFNDDKGVSLVLVNTERAAELFGEITEREESCVEVPLNKCVKHANSMKFPYPLPEDRAQFWEEYNKVGIGKIIKERVRKAKIKNTKRFIRKCLRLFIRL